MSNRGLIPTQYQVPTQRDPSSIRVSSYASSVNPYERIALQFIPTSTSSGVYCAKLKQSNVPSEIEY